MGINITQAQAEEFVKNVVGTDASRVKRELERACNAIEEYKQSLTNALKNKNMQESLLKMINSTEGFDLQKKLEEILNNKKIEKVEINNTTITMFTKPLICRASNGGLYDVGAFKIAFNAQGAGVRFFTLDNKYKRRSYWGDNCQHPHVSDTGSACLGNSAEPIAILNSQYEYSSIADICVAFLEQANLDDCAGRHVGNWDKVDANGNLIEGGCIDVEETRFKYGKTSEEDEFPSKRRCIWDGNRYEKNEMIYVQSEGVWINKENFKFRFSYCEECGELVDINKQGIIEIDKGKYVCKTHASLYKKCDLCGKFEKETNVKQENINGVDTNVCTTCLEKLITCSGCGKKTISPIKVIGAEEVICEVCAEHIGSENSKYVYDESFDIIRREDAVICTKCGDYVLRENAREVNGEFYCNYCELPTEGEEQVQEEQHAEQVETPYFETAEEAEAYYAGLRGENND